LLIGGFSACGESAQVLGERIAQDVAGGAVLLLGERGETVIHRPGQANLADAGVLSWPCVWVDRGPTAEGALKKAPRSPRWPPLCMPMSIAARCGFRWKTRQE